jgi:PKD repeat protein
MITTFRHRTVASSICAALVALTAGACNMKEQRAPGLTGPSEFALSLSLSATPDIVVRDGSSQSVVTLTARDAEGRPVSGQRVFVGLSPMGAGTLSASEVVTGADGRATVEFTAPASSSAVSRVTLTATPVGQNLDNAVSRTMSIGLLGPSAPSAAFVFTPTTPERLQAVTFDASSTTVDGAACGDACTYAWRFGSEQTATGRVVSYKFQNVGTYAVSLTVTSPSGTVATTSQNVVVSASQLTPVITASPTSPFVNQTVFIDGRSSQTSAGATIVSYEWDFGNGQTASGERPSTTYSSARTYTIRLTITDSLGRTATTTTQITISA